MHLQVDTTPVPPLYSGTPFVELEYLTSYERMGSVDVTCLKCVCNPMHIDANSAEQHSLVGASHQTDKKYATASNNNKINMVMLVQQKSSTD